MKNYIHEEIKFRLNLRNTCYQAVKNILPLRLLPQNVKIKVYETMTLLFCKGVKIGLSLCDN
jgi:hypothetical protein